MITLLAVMPFVTLESIPILPLTIRSGNGVLVGVLVGVQVGVAVGDGVEVEVGVSVGVGVQVASPSIYTTTLAGAEEIVDDPSNADALAVSSNVPLVTSVPTVV